MIVNLPPQQWANVALAFTTGSPERHEIEQALAWRDSSRAPWLQVASTLPDGTAHVTSWECENAADLEQRLLIVNHALQAYLARGSHILAGRVAP